MTDREIEKKRFEAALLASANDDRPPSGSLDRELARLGVAAGVGASAGAAATKATALFSSGTLTKLGVIATIAIAGMTAYVSVHEPPASIPDTAATETAPVAPA